MIDFEDEPNSHRRMTEEEKIQTLREVAEEDPTFYEFFATLVLEPNSEYHKVCKARLDRRIEKGISGLH